MIIPMTKLYLRIIFSGLIFTFMYNCFASTLRALGDSKSPLYFLIISSVVNVFGDLIFVLIFHMGSEGCAMTALMAQNKGAKKTDRIKAAFRCGMKIELFYGIFIFFVCFFLAHPLMQLFSNDPVVCKHGVTYLKLISLMYLFPAVTNGVQGYFRGIGDLKITLISSFVNMSVRVIFAAVLVFHFSLQIEALPFSYLAEWIGMLLAEVPLLLRKF